MRKVLKLMKIVFLLTILLQPIKGVEASTINGTESAVVTLKSPGDKSVITEYTAISVGVSINVDANRKTGDKIVIELPDYLEPKGASEISVKTPDANEVIGKVKLENGKHVLTFTEYVEKHDDIKVSFNLVLQPVKDIWKYQESKGIKLIIDGQEVNSGSYLEMYSPVIKGFTQSLTPIQFNVGGKLGAVHMYSTPIFKKDGVHTVTFKAENHQDMYYDCKRIKKDGITLFYGDENRNIKQINTVKDAEKYGIKLTCTDNTVTINMNVQEGYGYTTSVPLLLSENAVSSHSPGQFEFSNESNGPNGHWAGKEKLDYLWENGEGYGNSSTLEDTLPTTGGVTNYVAQIAGLILLSMGAIAFIYSRRRNN